jgi:D-amino-acid oxidase
MNILVIGSGVSGLSCSIRLLEAGHDVQIWARDLPPNTTSNIAAAVWYPYKAYPEHLVLGWSALAYMDFVQLAQVEGSGVWLQQGFEIFPEPADDPWWRKAVPSFRRAAPHELPDGYRDGFVFEAPVIEMDVYLPFLQQRFAKLGGQCTVRAVHDLAEAFAEHDLVVNCTGLGARELVNDTSMFPIRGQVVRVAQPGIQEFTLDDYNPRGVTYIVPRSNDCILGGTSEDGREDRTVEPDTAAAILERCVALEPRLRDATVLEHRVGLRPGRPTVRLEAEQWASGKTLVHNYGHGGAGVTLSWGCAAEVARLVNEHATPGRTAL